MAQDRRIAGSVGSGSLIGLMNDAEDCDADNHVRKTATLCEKGEPMDVPATLTTEMESRIEPQSISSPLR